MFDNLHSVISQLAEENLKSDDYYIVAVTVSSKKGGGKIAILLDGDQGVTINDCALLSRAVGQGLEEMGVMDYGYTLEVSSPGLDQPLCSLRQYKKNRGRKIKITISENTDIMGILKEVSDEWLLLDKEIKKGKKVTREPFKIAMKEVKKAVVQVSFR